MIAPGSYFLLWLIPPAPTRGGKKKIVEISSNNSFTLVKDVTASKKVYGLV